MLSSQNWVQLSAIQIGGVICMPVLMIGQTMIQHYGVYSSIIAVLIGNAVLFGLGLIAARMSVSNKKTTMENAIDYFGKEGVNFFSLAMVLMLVGWFAIQLNMMTLGVMDLFSLDQSSLSISTAINIALGLLITLGALFGVKGITLLANISLPLLIGTITYAAYTVENVSVADVVSEKIPLSFAGVSLVIAMAIGYVIDLPTYFRHAKSLKHAYIAITIIIGVCLPLLEIVGVYLAAANPEGTFLDIFKRSNSMVWNIWTASFLVLAGWTTNNVNLYSGVVCLQILIKKVPTYILTTAFGVVGIGLSCLDLLTHLSIVLETIGIVIGSMGGVIFSRYLLSRIKGMELTPQDHRLHLIAWMFGIVLGFVSWIGYSVSGISVLDATFGAALGTIIIIIRRPSYEKIYSQ